MDGERDPVADRVLEVAKGLGLETDRQIAEALDVPVPTIWRLRKGKRGVGLALRRRIMAHPEFGRFSRTYLFPDEAPAQVPA